MYTATDINKCGEVSGAGNSHLIVTHISVPHCRAQPGMKLVLWTSKQHCYTLIQQFIIQRLNYTTIWDIVIQVKSFKVSHLEYNFSKKYLVDCFWVQTLHYTFLMSNITNIIILSSYHNHKNNEISL